jgi:antitoxin (DNA-binding transcriptional repressor) of toxin-antitoxin stability system
MIFVNKIISVTEAARNFADCVNRAHYQKVTFVLLKGGSPVARIVPDEEKVCTGADLNKAVTVMRLAKEDASAWSRDLHGARNRLKPVKDKWR